MPNMHVSLFIYPKDRVEASSLNHTETRSFSVTVKVVNGDSRSEVALFADSLSQLADFGRAILEQCEKLLPMDAGDPFLPNYAGPSAVTHDFRPPSNKPGDPITMSVVSDPTTFDTSEPF